MWGAEAIAKRDIPLGKKIAKKGTSITISKLRKGYYALWWSDYIYSLPEKYVDKKSIKVFSEK